MNYALCFPKSLRYCFTRLAFNVFSSSLGNLVWTFPVHDVTQFLCSNLNGIDWAPKIIMIESCENRKCVRKARENLNISKYNAPTVIKTIAPVFIGKPPIWLLLCIVNVRATEAAINEIETYETKSSRTTWIAIVAGVVGVLSILYSIYKMYIQVAELFCIRLIRNCCYAVISVPRIALFMQESIGKYTIFYSFGLFGFVTYIIAKVHIRTHTHT